MSHLDPIKRIAEKMDELALLNAFFDAFMHWHTIANADAPEQYRDHARDLLTERSNAILQYRKIHKSNGVEA